MRAAFALAIAPLLLAGCQSDDPGPAGMTADETRQLNEAAAAIDINASANIVEPEQ
jgi:hypothetical protein